jgi:hypothetical protein
MRQMSPEIKQQDLVQLMWLSAVEIIFLEMHYLARFCGFGNLHDYACELCGRSMKRDVCLRDNADAPSPIVHNRDPSYLVFLHQLQALIQGVFGATRHGDGGHHVCNLDRISVLPGCNYARAQVTIRHDALKQTI